MRPDDGGYDAAINYHDPAWYQHQYNVAYGLYDRGWLNVHDLPRLRPQHCRRDHDHLDHRASLDELHRIAYDHVYDGGADINDNSARHDFDDEHPYNVELDWHDDVYSGPAQLDDRDDDGEFDDFLHDNHRPYHNHEHEPA